MSKRKADSTTVEGAPNQKTVYSFDKIRSHLKELERSGKLVEVLSTVWESKDWRENLLTKIDGKWSPLTNQDEIFDYDWKIDEDESRGIVLNFASSKVRLGSYGGIQNVATKECSGGSYEINEGGCEECQGSEVYNFDVQGKLDGSMRLVVDSYVECRCGGEEDKCEETSCIALPTMSKIS